MQNLEQRLAEAKKNNLSVLQTLNMVREYLQILVLKAIYQSPYKKSLSFMGGTCLRICYDLKRYSEDLDFALDQKVKGYSFQEINETAVRFLKQNGFEADVHVRDDKTVHKSFIRIRDILPRLGKEFRKDQKLHIKLEVDTNPIRITHKEIEIHFVVKFDENFPILKQTNEVLFAGKVLAVLNRVYTKGRDFYDIYWFLQKRVEPNWKTLKKTTGIKSERELKLLLLERAKKNITPQKLRYDLQNFFLDRQFVTDFSKNYLEIIKKYL